MSDKVTKEDLKNLDNKIDLGIDRLERKIDQAVTDLSEIIASFAQQVDTRFNQVEEQLEKLELSHQRLLNTVDGFVARIDSYETEMAARDAQFQKLLEWAKEVSEKTGIPLKGF